MKYILRKSQNNKYYFRDENGDIVMVNESIAAKWDDIDDVVIGEYTITKDKDGNDVPPRQQKEVVSYTSQIIDLVKTKKLETLKLDIKEQLELRAKELALKIAAMK